MNTETFERPGHAKSGYPGLAGDAPLTGTRTRFASGEDHVVGDKEHVPRMQSASDHANIRGCIERVSQMLCQTDHVFHSRPRSSGPPPTPDQGVERIGWNELLDQVDPGRIDTGSQRCSQSWMAQPGRHEPLELTHQLLDQSRIEYQLEQLDDDEAILLGFVRTIDGTERAGANLLKPAKPANRVGRLSGRFGVQ